MSESRAEKKRVAIVTYHMHDNYGAVLQCYALQQAIEEQGGDAWVLDYRCAQDLRPWSSQAIRARGLLPCAMSIAGVLLRLPRRKAFAAFRKRYHLSKAYTRETVPCAQDEFDCFIAGSDNVWNASITGFDKTYWLDFVTDDAKRCSYAASMGMAEPPVAQREEFERLLSGFRSLYVREKRAAQALTQMLGKTVESVLDPTLLLTAAQWREIAQRPAKRGYVLAYQMLPSSRFVRFAKKIARAMNRELVFVPMPMGGWVKRGCQMAAASPEQWLGLIDGADYVVTDSFHGSAFSILFEKPFSVWISQLGERITNLLDAFDLRDRIVTDEKGFDIEAKIDYAEVGRKLCAYREESLKALRYAVQGE